MQLTVNLSDSAEVAAALALLQTLDGSAAPVVAFGTATPDPAAVFQGGAVPAFAPGVAPLVGEVPPPLAPPAPSTANIAAGTPAIAVPPPPALSAPAIPTSGPALSVVSAPSAELDSAGVPWSPDLHAANKSKCKDGTWKARRGLTDAAAPAAPAATAPALAPAAPAVAYPADNHPTTYAQLMPRVTHAVTSGILPPAEMRVACEACGIASVVTLQEKPEFVPHVWAWLCQKYPALLTAQ